jgi:hypothetical protein
MFTTFEEIIFMSKTRFLQIGTYQYSSEAIIFKGKLESEGIEVFMRDNFTIDSDPLVSNAIGGVKLFVKNEDFEKASEILSTISKFSLDDNNNSIKCPKCNNDQIDMVTSIKDLKSLIAFLFSIIIVLIPFYSKHKYKCNSCNFEFN